MTDSGWGPVPLTSDDPEAADQLTERIPAAPLSTAAPDWGTPGYGAVTEPLWGPPVSPPSPVPWGYEASPGTRGAGRPLLLTALVAALVGAIVGAGSAVVVDRNRDRAALRDDTASLGSGISTPRDTTPGSVADVAARTLPSVVSISVSGPQGQGTGSGVILRADGYIITNSHVVTGASSITLQLASGGRVDADLVGRDPDSDLAVVKAKRGGLPAATLGQSKNLQVGDPVVAIGSPLGLAGTVTAGIISAVNRNVDVPGDTGGRSVLANAIQTDAAINPGNSGGALVDRAGRVIGINTAIATAPGGQGNIGVGFAIPIDEARAVAEQIIRTGRATHPFLGISGADITPQTASEYGITTDRGAVVISVQAGGPAAQAGLQEGDIVTRFDDRPIEGMGDLIAAIRAQTIGERVSLTYLRGGESRTATVTLQEKPSNAGG